MSDEFTRYYPVQVTILHFLVMLVFFNIKILKAVPAIFYCEFNTLQTMLNSAFVVTISFASISIGAHYTVVWSKFFPGLLSRLVEHNYHKGANKKCTVG